MLEILSRRLAKVCEIAVGTLMAFMTVVVILGVFYRYFLGQALPWSEELARYTMIWMCFLAASLLVRENGHIGITLLRDHLPAAGRKALYLVSDIAIIVFLGLWLHVSIESYEIVKDDISSGLNIRLCWVFASQPVCAFIMGVQAVLVFLRHLVYGVDAPAGSEGGA